MKKLSKILALVLAVLMLTALFSACKKKDNVLKVATNAEFEPFESLKGDEFVGFDVDLINQIAGKINMTIKFNNMEFDGVIAAIPAGTCDAAISGLTINEKRKKSVDFSDPYYQVSQLLIVKNNDTVFTGTTKTQLDEQLKGKAIGVCSGYTGETYAKGDADWGYKAIEGADVKVYDNPALAITDLKNGKIATIILDGPVAEENVAAAGNKGSIKTINVPLTTEYYGIAVKKGNTELLGKINTALKEIKDSGKLKELLDKWELK
jgi:polar amino acid transport system substrate-binding protein